MSARSSRLTEVRQLGRIPYASHRRSRSGSGLPGEGHKRPLGTYRHTGRCPRAHDDCDRRVRRRRVDAAEVCADDTNKRDSGRGAACIVAACPRTCCSHGQRRSTRHARAMATIAFLISSGRPGHAMTTPARSAGISRAVVLILCSRCADIVFRERPAFGGVASGSVRNSATRQSLSPCCCPDCDTTRPARDALRPVPDR